MFSQLPNASKACFHVMMGNFRKIGVALVDSQVANDHMRSLGGREISRDDYLEALRGLRVVNLLDRDWDGWLDPGLIP
jgi:leucyl/phenylalanyl-tRNA--protein transferase